MQSGGQKQRSGSILPDNRVSLGRPLLAMPDARYQHRLFLLAPCLGASAAFNYNGSVLGGRYKHRCILLTEVGNCQCLLIWAITLLHEAVPSVEALRCTCDVVTASRHADMAVHTLILCSRWQLSPAVTCSHIYDDPKTLNSADANETFGPS